MTELPQPRLQFQSWPQGMARRCSEAPPAAARLASMGWSQADELAALETVWESLCQDAASAGTALQLPSLTRAPKPPVGGQRPQRQRNRLAEISRRLAS
ncbi:hypothetical protein KBY82_12975 [Cyanobium sp. AMD-g]|uniref:hypothetical protein n=1 Tax=Cyanobium sp. AMD-g TaxID=2823699 RepID=UPI0020CE2695|nr:hypothetical protein [Cyanobium sp. AMD-g]MCP9931694.1 hypothetical protein [Cyanobium sp. AMD-g]